MSLARSIVEHFVRPPGGPLPAAHEDFVPPDEGPERACAEPAPRTPPGVAVLSAAPDALALGATLGLALARRAGVRAAVVCIWAAEPPAGPPWRAPGLPAARKLAATLAVRGHDARAAGRLALIRLPPAPGEAAVQARRVAAVARATPIVLALGGPRHAAFDVLLGEQDLVVLATRAGTDPALARLALAGLGPRTARACVCEVPAPNPARAVAAAGLALLPSARRAFAGPVETLS